MPARISHGAPGANYHKNWLLDSALGMCHRSLGNNELRLRVSVSSGAISVTHSVSQSAGRSVGRSVGRASCPPRRAVQLGCSAAADEELETLSRRLEQLLPQRPLSLLPHFVCSVVVQRLPSGALTSRFFPPFPSDETILR